MQPCSLSLPLSLCVCIYKCVCACVSVFCSFCLCFVVVVYNDVTRYNDVTISLSLSLSKINITQSNQEDLTTSLSCKPRNAKYTTSGQSLKGQTLRLDQICSKSCDQTHINRYRRVYFLVSPYPALLIVFLKIKNKNKK